MRSLNAGLAAMAMAAGMAAQAATPDTQTTKTAQGAAISSSATPAATTRVIVVSLEDRKLALVENGEVVKTYSVAVGKPSTPSPTGEFTIARRVMNPTYHHDGRTVLPGPRNPVGDRWMGLSEHGYGIHGTNEPNSIGKAASHGCIRMGKADIEDLYTRVEVGDQVEIVGQRDEQTAKLFGGPQIAPSTHAQPAVVLAAAGRPAGVNTGSGSAVEARSTAAATEAAVTLLRHAGSTLSGLVVMGLL